MEPSANPSCHECTETPLAHVVEVRTLLAVFAALIVLTAITVAVSYFDFGAVNLLVALGVGHDQGVAGCTLVHASSL